MVVPMQDVTFAQSTYTPNLPHPLLPRDSREVACVKGECFCLIKQEHLLRRGNPQADALTSRMILDIMPAAWFHSSAYITWVILLESQQARTTKV